MACYINQRQFLTRGKQLYQKFKTPRGGISEIIPRISEILPLCLGSCPDCLGDSRLSLRKAKKSFQIVIDLDHKPSMNTIKPLKDKSSIREIFVEGEIAV